jgi:hypothetical protein
MMKIKQKRISVQFTRESLQVCQRNILQKFNPLIASMKREYWNRISLPSSEVDNWLAEEIMNQNAPTVVGDLLMTDPDTLIYYKFEQAQNQLEAGIITRGETQNLAPFCAQLLEIVESSNMVANGEWQDLSFPSDVIESVRDVSKVIQPAPQEVQAAGFLEEEMARRFLERIKGAEATSLYKLVDSRELPKLGPIVDKLEKMGLLTKDFVVICSKTGQPILKVSSRSAIEESSTEANKCFICGNPLSKETIDEIVYCSDFGKKLVENSYWFPIRLLSSLEQFGIPNDQVYVQVSESDLINLFMILNEQSYLFVLCNRKLTIDDAYYINAYVSAYSVNHTLIICTEKPTAIMKKHIENNNKDTAITFIDSLRNFDNTISLALIEREKTYISKMLEAFTPLTPIKIQDLVMRRVGRVKLPAGPQIRPRERTVAAEQSLPPAPAAREPVSKPSAEGAMQRPTHYGEVPQGRIPYAENHPARTAAPPQEAASIRPSAPPPPSVPPPPVPEAPPAARPAPPPEAPAVRPAAPPEAPPRPAAPQETAPRRPALPPDITAAMHTPPPEIQAMRAAPPPEAPAIRMTPPPHEGGAPPQTVRMAPRQEIAGHEMPPRRPAGPPPEGMALRAAPRPDVPIVRTQPPPPPPPPEIPISRPAAPVETHHPRPAQPPEIPAATPPPPPPPPTFDIASAMKPPAPEEIPYFDDKDSVGENGDRMAGDSTPTEEDLEADFFMQEIIPMSDDQSGGERF